MSSTPDGAGPAADHALAVRLVTECGDLADRMRADGVDTEFKSSMSDVVTAADRAAESLVVSTVQQERPSDGLLGEGGAFRRGASGRRWVIDPVDGTYNFTIRIPYWCSALALEGADGTLLGAVYQPSTGEVWVGGAGTRTTRNGIAVGPLVPRPLGECVLAAVASGRLDLWVQHSTAEWDWLPGKALVDAAGGRTEVVRHRGHTWQVAGNRQAVGDVLDVLRVS